MPITDGLGGCAGPVLGQLLPRGTVQTCWYRPPARSSISTGRVRIDAVFVGPVDLDALVEYVEALPTPFTSQIEGRIVLTT
jgi:hypothetical protein